MIALCICKELFVYIFATLTDVKCKNAYNVIKLKTPNFKFEN